MSLIIIKNLKIIEKQLIKNNPLRIIAFYSRRNNSKSSDDSPYKYVSPDKLGFEENSQPIEEGGPNWELLAPKSNRFYLKNFTGPAWQNNSSTISAHNDCLEELVDFSCKDPKKLWITSTPCPILFKNSLVELFPAPEVVGPEPLTIISLKASPETDTEIAAKNFVLAAREICIRLRSNGYWADFMNCFSGKPFYSYSNGKLFKVDERFRGLGMKFETINGCMVISSSNQQIPGIPEETTTNATVPLEKDKSEEFSGIIISNIFSDITKIQALIGD